MSSESRSYAVTSVLVMLLLAELAAVMVTHSYWKRSVNKRLDGLEAEHRDDWHQGSMATLPEPVSEPCFDMGLAYKGSGQTCPHPDHRIMAASSALDGTALYCVCPRKNQYALYPQPSE